MCHRLGSDLLSEMTMQFRRPEIAFAEPRCGISLSRIDSHHRIEFRRTFAGTCLETIAICSETELTSVVTLDLLIAGKVSHGKRFRLGMRCFSFENRQSLLFVNTPLASNFGVTVRIQWTVFAELIMFDRWTYNSARKKNNTNMRYRVRHLFGWCAIWDTQFLFVHFYTFGCDTFAIKSNNLSSPLVIITVRTTAPLNASISNYYFVHHSWQQMCIIRSWMELFAICGCYSEPENNVTHNMNGSCIQARSTMDTQLITKTQSCTLNTFPMKVSAEVHNHRISSPCRTQVKGFRCPISY